MENKYGTTIIYEATWDHFYQLNLQNNLNTAWKHAKSYVIYTRLHIIAIAPEDTLVSFNSH